MSYLEELFPEFRRGAKIRCDYWDKGQYIQLKEDGYIYDDKGDRIEVSTLILFSNSWEFYQEPIDWNYIIKNKCLCWFWEEYSEYSIIGTLSEINNDGDFKMEKGLCYSKCRPIRRDEITFYEDKKDE